MNLRIAYELVSDLESDAMIFEVWVDGQLFAEVIEGVPLTARVYPRPGGGAWAVSVRELEAALSHARANLGTLPTTSTRS